MFEKLIPEKGGDGTRSEGLLRVVADVLEPTGASSWFDFEWAVAGWPLPAARLSLSLLGRETWLFVCHRPSYYQPISSHPHYSIF